MRDVSSIFGVALSLFFAAATGLSQVGQNTAEYQTMGKLLLSRSHTALWEQSSAADRAILDKIHATIPPVENVNGVAFIAADGKRTIEISAGIIEVIDWVAIAEAIKVLTGNKDCELRYVSYLGDAVATNTSLHKTHTSLMPVQSPFQFYDAHRSSCPHVTEDDIRRNQRANLTRDLVINASFMQVYAHEVGHHIHNDPYSAAASWCDQQKREARADAYSFEVLKDGHMSPIVGVPVLLIFATAEGFSADDTERSHPAALKRVLAMYEATRSQVNSDPELRSELQKNGSLAEFYKLADQYKSAVESEIQSSPANQCQSEGSLTSQERSPHGDASFGDGDKPSGASADTDTTAWWDAFWYSKANRRGTRGVCAGEYEEINSLSISEHSDHGVSGEYELNLSFTSDRNSSLRCETSDDDTASIDITYTIVRTTSRGLDQTGFEGTLKNCEQEGSYHLCDGLPQRMTWLLRKINDKTVTLEGELIGSSRRTLYLDAK